MFEHTVFWMPQFIAGLSSITVAFYLWRKRSVPGTKALLVLLIAVGEWALFSALHKASPGLSTKILIAKIQYLGIVTVPPALLIFVLQFTGRERWLTGRNFVLLAIFPAITLALAWTNEAHKLIWKGTWIDISGPVPIGVYDYGHCFWIWISFSYLAILLSTVLLVKAFLDSPRFYRMQALIMLVGIVTPWVANGLYILNISPWPRVDLTPIAFTVTALALGCGMFWVRIFDIVPVAHATVLKSMPDGVIVLDDNKRIVNLNPAARRFLHLPDSGIIGQSALQLFADQPTLIEHLGDLTEVRSELILGQGDTQHYYDLYISPFKDRQGSLMGRLITLRDFTERKRGEEALRASEEKFRLLAENIPGVVYLCLNDQRHTMLYLNEEVEVITGYPKGDFLQDRISFVKLYHPEDADWIPLEVERALAKRKPFHILYRIRHQSGEWRWIEEFGIGVFRGEDSAYIEGFLHDITGAKQAEAALVVSEQRYRNLYDKSKRSEEVYRSLLHTSADAIVTYDMEEKVTYVNPSFTQIFGWTLEEAKGKRIPFVPESEREATVSCIKKIVEKGQSVQGLETKYYSKDSCLIDVSVSGSQYNDHERNPAGILAVIRDTSEKKKLETQFQQAQRMESLGTLAAGTAHDFNNLLMGILGRASLMLMTKNSAHPDFEHLKGIEDYVRNAADLTKQLLGLARGGKFEIKPTVINDLVKKSSTMFGRTKKEIVVHSKFQKDLWVVEVDQGQIDQVLMNLYVNAWQAMPEGGDLYLETENVTLDKSYVKPFSMDPGKYVKLSLTDTGLGMDKATQERMFDPFFTTREMGRGTGLGLASVYGIIKGHGGFIDVSSKKGEGSTFNIYLPASESDAGDQKSDFSEDVRHGHETLLLVDDEEMIIEVEKKLMTALGYTVLTAKGGKKAVEIFEKNRDKIDLIILDMIMPGMGGGETYDRFKKINPDIRIILSSGYSINDQAREILRRGCDGFIQKPFDMRLLSHKLREVLGKTT